MSGAVEYVLIGHISADLTSAGGRVLGGTVSFAARTAHAFGLRVGLVTSAAADEPLLAELLPFVAETAVVPAAATTSFENLYSAAGRTQYLRGRAERLTLADVPAAWRSAPMVHLAPLADEVDVALAHGFPRSAVMLTPQGWLRQWDAAGLVRFKRWFDPDALKALTVVVLSEEDIAADPDLERLYAQAAPWVVVTRGEHGGTCYRGGEVLTYAAERVQVADVTGAGDVFAATLLASWSAMDGDLRAALRVAAKLAARSVTRPGLTGTPVSDEARRALAEVT